MRKAQAAFEFLSTYGWAMITLILVLGALYLGFTIKPNDTIADSCTFIDALSCNDYQITSNGIVNLNMRNLAGNAMDVVGVDCVFDGTTYTNSYSPTIPVASGAYFDVSCDLQQTLPDDKIKVQIAIRYVLDGKSFTTTSDGALLAKPSS